MDCVFCAIVQKKIPAHILFEDADTLVFLTNEPVNEGHALVIPKKHVVDFFGLSSEALAKLMNSAQRMSETIMHALNADGLNLEMNNGAAAGQSVFHAHIHLIPRFTGDGFRHWPHKSLNSEQLKAIQEKIKSAFMSS